MAGDPEGASYEQVAALSEDELRGLLHRGRPVQRTHAAWALGVHLGRGLAPLLAQLIRLTPNHTLVPRNPGRWLR